MEYTTVYHSPVGEIMLAGNEKCLTGLWFEGQKYFGSTLDRETQNKELPVFEETGRWLDLYFSGKEPDFLPPLAPKGSEFRRRVWKHLLEIPYGETTTYGALAKEIAKEMGRDTMSAQAVGGAVGHNPISILIPCHRLLGADGSLTGYAAGLEVKKRLLMLEKQRV